MNQSYPIVEIFTSIQGEGIYTGVVTTFVRFAGCNLTCEFCFVPDTLVTMEDLFQKPISEIKVGDRVLALHNREAKGQHMYLAPTTVTNTTVQHNKQVLALSTAQEKLIGTANHPLLNVKHREYWKDLGAFKVDDVVVQLPKINNLREEEKTELFKLGWLTGVIEGDGSFFTQTWPNGNGTQRKFRIASNDQEIVDTVIAYADHFGILLREVKHTGGIGNVTVPAATSTKTEETILLKALISQEWYTSVDWLKGYAAGIFDAEGSYDGDTIKIAQLEVNEPTRIKIAHVLSSLGYEYSMDIQGPRLLGGLNTAIKFFAECAPVLYRKRSKLFPVGVSAIPKAPVISLPKDAGVSTVYNLTTEAGTYIANNIVVHNCDTKESWNVANATQMTIPEILEQCTASRVVLTGGEPTLYHLTPLIEALKKQPGFSHKLRKVAIETNGTRALSPNWNLDWVTCSPKAPKFDIECRCNELKYVITDDFDPKVIRREAVKRGHIFLQPESHRFESMQKAYKLAMMCPEYLRVGLQMHKVFEVR